MPFWASSFYYVHSDAILFCTYPFSDHSQIQVSISGVVHVIICISIICYCYLQIYRFYRLARERRHNTENKGDSFLQSFVLKEDTRKKDEDNEFRVFATTVLLIGWTMIGNVFNVTTNRLGANANHDCLSSNHWKFPWYRLGYN